MSVCNSISSVGAYSFHSPAVTVSADLSNPIQKIKNIVSDPQFYQVFIGFAIGLAMPYALGAMYPYINQLTRLAGIPLDSIPQDPLHGMSRIGKIALAPLVCISGPIIEEYLFRGKLQESLKIRFEGFYSRCGMTEEAAQLSARISTIFFSSILFGLVHFSNALDFWCNPILFLPQVVMASIMGIAFGIAKECTNNLYLPTGMHIGNNTLAWAMLIHQ